MYAQLKDGRRLPVSEVAGEYVHVVINNAVQPIKKDKVARFIGSRNMSHSDFDQLNDLRKVMGSRRR